MAKLPTAAWACLTLAFLGILATLAFLSATKSDTADFWRFLLAGGQIVSVLLSGGGLVLSGQAQKQTNGGLDARIQAAVAGALDSQRAADVQPGGLHDPAEPTPDYRRDGGLR